MAANEPLRVPCPTCRQPAVYGAANPWRPFCSERCSLLDLSRWLDGDYRVEGPAEGSPADADPDDPEATNE